MASAMRMLTASFHAWDVKNHKVSFGFKRNINSKFPYR